MTRFKDNLLNDLMREHGQTVEEAPEQRRGLARPLLVAAGALAIAGAATVAVTANSTREAWAVTKNNDGSVTVTIRDIEGVDPANAKLREYGIRAKAVRMSKDCAWPDDGDFDVARKWGPFVGADGSATIRPGDVPEGYTLLLGIPKDAMGLAAGLPIQTPAPDCLPGQRATRPP